MKHIYGVTVKLLLSFHLFEQMKHHREHEPRCSLQGNVWWVCLSAHGHSSSYQHPTGNVVGRLCPELKNGVGYWDPPGSGLIFHWYKLLTAQRKTDGQLK